MSIRRLPPLNALRAFEAAARHGNFSKAATELHVTHAAISHQVRALEEEAGVALFHRTGRAVVLTDAGLSLLPVLSTALDQMAEGWAQTRGETGGPVTVSVEPSFAARWLVLRLGRFNRAYPDLSLRLMPSGDLIDFDRQDVDLGIRYGHGDWENVTCERLFEATVYPVCAPSFLSAAEAAGKPTRSASDLRFHTLLHEETVEHWQDWLRALRPTTGSCSKVGVPELAKTAAPCAYTWVYPSDSLGLESMMRYVGHPSWMSTAKITSIQAMCRGCAGQEANQSVLDEAA